MLIYQERILFRLDAVTQSYEALNLQEESLDVRKMTHRDSNVSTGTLKHRWSLLNNFLRSCVMICKNQRLKPNRAALIADKISVLEIRWKLLYFCVHLDHNERF